MQLLSKWDYNWDCLGPYPVPDGWKCVLRADSEDEMINCAQCGKEIPYGKSCVSMEILTPAGFGYAVCDDCAHEELERRYRAMQRKEKRTPSPFTMGK